MTRPRAQAPEPRRFYKIGDAARLVGVKPHVLRYWEGEFPELRPLKTRGAHRMYGEEHLALARRIRELVVDRGYTVPGARRRLRADRDAARDSGATPAPDEVLGLRRELLALRARLVALLGELDAPVDAASGAPGRARGGSLDAPRRVRVEAVAATPRRWPSGG